MFFEFNGSGASSQTKQSLLCLCTLYSVHATCRCWIWRRQKLIIHLFFPFFAVIIKCVSLFLVYMQHECRICETRNGTTETEKIAHVHVFIQTIFFNNVYDVDVFVHTYSGKKCNATTTKLFVKPKYNITRKKIQKSNSGNFTRSVKQHAFTKI